MTPIAQLSTASVGLIETPSLDLNFKSSESIFATKGPTPILTRGSAGTYVDEYGIVRNSNPNLLLYSNTLETTGGAWASSVSGVAAVAILGNQILSPDNSVNASRLTFPAVTTGTYAVWQQSITTSTTGNYVFSVWLKAGTLSKIWIRLKTDLGDSNKQLCNLTSTWQRCFFNVNITSAITNVIVEIGANGNYAEEINNAGNLYAWGAQLEASSYLGRYSPTTSSSTNNAPRLDHDCSKAATVATNLNTNSEDFSSGFYIRAGTTVSTNFATAPDGTLTADKIIESATTYYHSFYHSITCEANEIYSNSIFVKKYSGGATDSRYFGLGMSLAGSGENRFQINVDLQTGTVTAFKRSKNYGDYAARTNYNIEDYGTYWRVSISGQSQINGFLIGVVLLSNSSSPPYDAKGDYQYTGDGTSGITIWGMQWQKGLIATQYIKTTGSAASGTATYQNKGLLIEESRTNVLTYSEDLSDASWTKTNVTLSANYTIAPDGAFSADRITDTSATTYFQVGKTVSGSTASIFVKKYSTTADSRYCQFLLSDNSTGKYSVNVDLQYGTITEFKTLNSPTTYGAQVNDFGAYWRISSSIAYLTSFIVGMSNAALPTYDASLFVTYTGAASKSMVIWGGQAESGTFPTSYIPTAAAAVTRNAESCSISSTDFSGFYNQTEGTSRIEYTSRPKTSGTYSLATYKDDTSALFLKHLRTSLAETSLYKGDASIGAQFDSSSQGVDGAGEMTISYKADNFSCSFNGGNLKTDASGVVSSAFTSLNIGVNESSTNSLNGCISRLRYYKKRILDSKVKAMSYDDELNWRNVGPQYYQRYRGSIANTIATTTTVPDVTTIPSGTYSVGTTSAAFYGAVLLPDGRVFCVPYSSLTARIYDPVTDTLSTPSGTYPGSNAFNSGVLLPDGRVFCVPRDSPARIYDPVTDTLSTPSGTYPGSNAFNGGVLLADGRVFCIPRISLTARIYDPVTDTLSTPSGTYPGSNAFNSGVLLPDGRVFCVPRDSLTARIYNPVTDTLSTPSGTYPGLNAFCVGILLKDGRVFCVPRSSVNARIYDPVTDTLSTPSGTYPGSNAFNSGVLLPDGRVFCLPFNSTSARIYDPATDTLSTPSGTYPGTGSYIGAVSLLDGRTFCSPFNSNTALIYGAGVQKGFDKNVVLSSYYNKL